MSPFRIPSSPTVKVLMAWVLTEGAGVLLEVVGWMEEDIRSLLSTTESAARLGRTTKTGLLDDVAFFGSTTLVSVTWSLVRFRTWSWLLSGLELNNSSTEIGDIPVRVHFRVSIWVPFKNSDAFRYKL